MAARSRACFAPRRGIRRGTIGPARFQYDFDLDSAVRKMYARAYEIHIVGILRQLLRPGDTFVDVGANIGYLSCVAASRVGRSGRVLRFEPAPACFARLKALREMNPDYDWQVYSLGLGAAATSAELVVNCRNIGWNSLVPNQIPPELVNSRVPIPVRPLDDCLREAGVERVRLLKIDVEGYEGPVILGASSYLQEGRIDNLVVEILPSQYPALGLDFNDLMRFMRDCRYQARQSISPYRSAQAQDFVDGADIWFQRDPQ